MVARAPRAVVGAADDGDDVDVDVVAKQNYSNFKVNEFVRIHNPAACVQTIPGLRMCVLVVFVF